MIKKIIGKIFFSLEASYLVELHGCQVINCLLRPSKKLKSVIFGGFLDFSRKIEQRFRLNCVRIKRGSILNRRKKPQVESFSRSRVIYSSPRQWRYYNSLWSDSVRIGPSKVRENGSNDFYETLHVVAHPKGEKSDEARFSKKILVHP